MPFDGLNAPTERTLEILDELRILGVFSLLISGGEPTIHPDFFRIVETSAKNIPNLTINTNGIRLANRSFAVSLAKYAPHALIAISLDSPDSRINNAKRGAGGTQAVKAIENCVELGLTVCISAVLTESNTDTAPLLIERFAPAVSKYRFFPQMPTSLEALAKAEKEPLNTKRAFYSHLSRISLKHKHLEVFTPYGKNPNDFSMPDGVHAPECLCTETKLYLNSRLEAFPCFYSASPAAKLGDCLNQSVEQIWASARAQHIRSQAQLRRLCEVEFTRKAVPARYRQVIPLLPAPT